MECTHGFLVERCAHFGEAAVAMYRWSLGYSVQEEWEDGGRSLSLVCSYEEATAIFEREADFLRRGERNPEHALVDAGLRRLGVALPERG